MTQPRILVQNLGKRYLRHAPERPRRWRDLLNPRSRGQRGDAFWALRGVSFSLHAGQMLGVIGPNGAGKSTLLCLLGGVGQPTEGHAMVQGRIGALLDLGGGFVGDLTGRENAMLAGVVAGLTRDEVRAQLAEIVAFAEMEDFLDEPVRTYSSGMTMRLAFSVAVHTRPDVLLVDEYLSVGDLAFQARCRARIRALRDAGCAIVLVTHDVAQVRELCDRALWLREGRVAALDEPENVTRAYENQMREETLRRTPATPPMALAGGRRLSPHENRFGSLEIEIIRVDTRPAHVLRSGETLEVELEYRSAVLITAPVFVVSLTQEDGTVVLDTNTQSARVATADVHGGGRIRFRIDRLDVAAGHYFINVGVFEQRWSHAYDYHWHVYPLTVEGAAAHKGVLAPPCRWFVDPPQKITTPDRDRTAAATTP